MTKTLIRFLSVALIPALITGCSIFSGDEEKPPLEGERMSILELQKNLEPETGLLGDAGFILPEPWKNEFWPQAGGYPNHAMQHLGLGAGPLELAWTADIGDGSTKELPLTSQPIVVDGRVFTMDIDSNLTAFSVETGKELWRIDVRDLKEDDPVIGGGLSYSRGQLYATTGYSEVIAVSPQDGSLKWRVPIPAAARAAPTVAEERVFVNTLDNRLLALSPNDGSVLWEYVGVAENAGLVGAASPAASRSIVIPAFSSGEIFALRIENGTVAWTESLAALRPTPGLGALSDIRGLPVIDKGVVIAVSFGGRIAAIDERSGTRIWVREIGGSETPWVAGNHVYVVSSNNELVALERNSGAIRWVIDLPKYEDPKDKDGSIFWTGPVYAGGRLILGGSHGRILEVDPQSGKTVSEWKAKGPVTIPPIVAGNTLYILSDNGILQAYK